MRRFCRERHGDFVMKCIQMYVILLRVFCHIKNSLKNSKTFGDFKCSKSFRAIVCLLDESFCQHFSALARKKVIVKTIYTFEKVFIGIYYLFMLHFLYEFEIVFSFYS